MGFFDKLLGKKAESAAKSPEAKKSLEQPAPASPGKELPSGVQLKQEQAADTATSEAEVRRIQDQIRNLSPEALQIKKTIGIAPGQAGHESLQRASNLIRSIGEASELGIAKGDVTYGGEVGADVESMVGGKAAASGIEGGAFAGAKQSSSFVERGQGGAAMFRLSDMQEQSKAPDKKRAA